MNIISISRRTDIPAFYGNWFMNKLKQGFVEYKNPFNQKVYSVSLKPDDVYALVFWSKNFKPFIKYLSHLDKYRFYFHYTITGLPKIIENRTPPLTDSIDNFKYLADIYSNRVLWRFDPIVLSNISPIDYHLNSFNRISEKLIGYTKRCYISFVQTHYKKVKRQFSMANKNVTLLDTNLDQQKSLLNSINAIAKKRNISLYICCQNKYLASDIKQARCIDKGLLEELYPNIRTNIKLNKTRQDCACYNSVDIGTYNTCINNCIYCYAGGNNKHLSML